MPSPFAFEIGLLRKSYLPATVGLASDITRSLHCCALMVFNLSTSVAPITSWRNAGSHGRRNIDADFDACSTWTSFAYFQPAGGAMPDSIYEIASRPVCPTCDNC